MAHSKSVTAKKTAKKAASTKIYVIMLQGGGDTEVTYTTDRAIFDWIEDRNDKPPQAVIDLIMEKPSKFTVVQDSPIEYDPKNPAPFVKELIEALSVNPISGSYLTMYHSNDKALTLSSILSDAGNYYSGELYKFETWATKKGFKIVDTYEGGIY